MLNTCIQGSDNLNEGVLVMLLGSLETSSKYVYIHIAIIHSYKCM